MNFEICLCTIHNALRITHYTYTIINTNSLCLPSTHKNSPFTYLVYEVEWNHRLPHVGWANLSFSIDYTYCTLLLFSHCVKVLILRFYSFVGYYILLYQSYIQLNVAQLTPGSLTVEKKRGKEQQKSE